MKTTIIIIVFAICSLYGICKAQSQFQNKISGVNNERAYSIVYTSDGGYAVAGWTNSFTSPINNNMYILKLDAGGGIQWSKTIGGTNEDNAWCIIQTSDGGYAIAGVTLSFGMGGGANDMFIVKLDNSGTFQWSKAIGGTGNDWANSIKQTTDGGYIIAGYTRSFGAGNADMYILKLDANGTLQWNKTVGGASFDYGNSVIQTSDGGYAVAGYTLSFGAGSFDMYIVKLDATGTLQWNKTIGGTDTDVGNSIIQTSDGGYAIAGYTFSFAAGEDDMYIVKLDAAGMLQWTRTFGDTIDDEAYQIIQTTDGGYAVSGYIHSIGTTDMYIVRLNPNGSLQWSRTVGGEGGQDARSITKTPGGEFVAAGYTHPMTGGTDEVYIVKLDTAGNTCGNMTSPASLSGTGGTTISPSSIFNSPIPTVTSVTPVISSGGTLTAVCVIGIQPISNEIPSSFQLYQNYPNPFNPVTNIEFSVQAASFVKLSVYDILGRELETIVNENLKPGTYNADWNASAYPSGVYFYNLSAADFSETKKMVLIK